MLTVFPTTKASPILDKVSPIQKSVDESTENYLTHPTFGLLYSVGQLEENVELYTTIYAKRLFFLVTSYTDCFKFESIGRQDARLLVDKRLYYLRTQGRTQEYDKLTIMCRQTFG